jgi:pimeloyl-ACP methyl ester carboxylesterase
VANRGLHAGDRRRPRFRRDSFQKAGRTVGAARARAMAKKTWKKGETEVRSYLPSGMSRLVVFFGGFFDETFQPVKRFVDQAIGSQRYGVDTGIYYFSWSDAAWWSDFAQEKIGEIVSRSEVDSLALVGHSYGGHSASKVARGLGLDIDVLVTVDAVSWESGLFWFSKPSRVDRWINAYCGGVGDVSDLVAVAGGHWGHESGADRNIKVPGATHAQFTKMFLVAEKPLEAAIGLR